MNTIKTIYYKEMRRVLFDIKMVFGLFIMPILMMALIYGIMGFMAFTMFKDIEEHKSSVYVYGAPKEFVTMLKDSDNGGVISTVEDYNKLEELKDMVVVGDADYIIEFPDNFYEDVTSYKEGDKVPQVKTYYNPSEDYSESAESKYSDILEKYRIRLLEDRVGTLDSVSVFTVNSDNDEAELQDDSKAGGKFLGMILPYIISILLFAGAMSLGSDSIAGEKERGTMATMLVLPVKRSHIVYGKLLALMSLSAMTACVYGAGMIVSIPVATTFMSVNGMKLSISLIQGILLLVLVISMVFVYVAIVAALSVFAKDMKEASTYIMPAYLVVIISGVMTMFRSSDTNTFEYFIPLYGPAMAMRNILTQEITNIELLLTIVVNLLVGAAIAFVIAKAFENERVMLNA